MNKAFPLLLVAMGLGLVLYVIFRSEKPVGKPLPVIDRGTSIDDFVLTERSGKSYSSEQLLGHVWVASFFFASCPTTCLQQNQTVQKLANTYQDVHFVSITCDPESDTPARLQEYASSFQARPDQWVFLTGELNYIRMIGQDAFKVLVDKQTHSNRLLLVDKWGKVRGRFDWNDPRQLETLNKKIVELNQEKQPPANAT